MEAVRKMHYCFYTSRVSGGHKEPRSWYKHVGCHRVWHASLGFRDLGKNPTALNLETVYRMVSCVGVGGGGGSELILAQVIIFGFQPLCP